MKPHCSSSVPSYTSAGSTWWGKPVNSREKKMKLQTPALNPSISHFSPVQSLRSTIDVVHELSEIHI